jgi:hypothetical protein
MNYEYERILKAVVTYFKAFFQNLPGDREEGKDNLLQDGRYTAQNPSAAPQHLQR